MASYFRFYNTASSNAEVLTLIVCDSLWDM